MDLIRWQAPEFERHERGALWYYAVIAAGGVIVFVALWQGNFLFAVFAVVAALLLLFWSRQEPRTLEFALGEHGLAIGDGKRYSWGDLGGFSMEEVGEGAEFFDLVFSRAAALGTDLKILAPAEERDAIRELLSEHLPEEEYRPSLMEAVIRLLKL